MGCYGKFVKDDGYLFGWLDRLVSKLIAWFFMVVCLNELLGGKQRLSVGM